MRPLLPRWRPLLYLYLLEGKLLNPRDPVEAESMRTFALLCYEAGQYGLPMQFSRLHHAIGTHDQDEAIAALQHKLAEAENKTPDPCRCRSER